MRKGLVGVATQVKDRHPYPNFDHREQAPGQHCQLPIPALAACCALKPHDEAHQAVLCLHCTAAAALSADQKRTKKRCFPSALSWNSTTFFVLLLMHCWKAHRLQALPQGVLHSDAGLPSGAASVLRQLVKFEL